MIYLASQSPRRRVLLEQLGVPFKTLAIRVDESWDGVEPACDHVVRLAIAKARAGCHDSSELESLCVLAADTAVVLDGDILGKPEGRAQGLDMLARLSGRSHQVYTAVALITPGGNQEFCRVNVTRVYFRPLTLLEQESYWGTGEPLGKAGGYAIQGLAAAFIERIEGSYSGVMGLPLYETAELLSQVGVNVLSKEAL